VKSLSVDSHARDAYWHATQAELKSIQNRGDAVTLLLVATVGALLAIFRNSWEQATAWNILVVTLPFVAISISVWFVISRRRRVAAARGLVCGECGYMPHDTEITAIAQTRSCPRCEASLES
jgi:hypothetical protein